MNCSSCSLVLVLLIVTLSSVSYCCYGYGTYGFDIHHRFSDPVKGVLSVDGLPNKGSLEYYAKMVHRDRVFRGRGLAGEQQDELITFADGNETLRIGPLGFLYYANISLGTPSKWFLVALDTGSDLFWVPCDCKSCFKGLGLRKRSGDILVFNIYSPNSSSTSRNVPCDSNLCENKKECSGRPGRCPYRIQYVSNNTSSSGVMIEDVLHLTTQDNHRKVLDANVTFGCGQIQTGSFLDSAAPNGLFGLGMDKISVPSILSSSSLTADSFSMCFGPDGIGRINFGDKGSPDQEETPLDVRSLHPTYNISLTQISVATNQTNVEFSAIFDSGTSFTYLSDPAYTLITETFNSEVQDKRQAADSDIPFEYCYDLSPVKKNTIPNVTLTMKGASLFPVLDPIVFVSASGMGSTYCLGVVKSPNVNIIGQNFMTGYSIVFDREKLVLGWKESNCYDIQDSVNVPVNPPTSTAPAIAVEPRNFTPEATTNTESGFHISKAQPTSGKSSRFYTIISTLVILFLPIFIVG